MSEVSLVDGHIDNGMTDEDIIKALEYCSKQGITSECESCKYKKGCRTELINDALKLIDCYKAENEKLNIELKAMRGAANSYKAEVERLQKEIEVKDTVYQRNTGIRKKRIFDLMEEIKTAKAETIKEFAEKLKNCFAISGDYLDIINIIDNLVKEMTESK